MLQFAMEQRNEFTDCNPFHSRYQSLRSSFRVRVLTIKKSSKKI